MTATRIGFTYVFTIPPPPAHCTGSLVAVEYCYQVFDNANTEREIFSLLSLSRNGFIFTVDSRFTARSAPIASRCTNPNGQTRKICCDKTTFPSQISFPLPGYSFGVIIINGNALPLTFANSGTEFDFDHFQTALGNPGPPVGNVFTLGSSSLVTGPSLLMRFFIGKHYYHTVMIADCSWLIGVSEASPSLVWWSLLIVP